MSFRVSFCSCVFSVLLAFRLPRSRKRELVLVLFVRLLDLRLFGFCLFSLPLGVWEGLRFVVCLSVCYFVLVFFSPFSIAITSLGEERANLSAFRAFVRSVLVWICRFLFILGSGKGCGF